MTNQQMAAITSAAVVGVLTGAALAFLFQSWHQDLNVTEGDDEE